MREISIHGKRSIGIFDQFKTWDESKGKHIYIPVKFKLVLSFLFACVWFGVSVWLAYPWLRDLEAKVGLPLAWFIICGIAFVPGLANAFIVSGLFLDNRPQFKKDKPLPPISVIVCAYNEENTIKETIYSIISQEYPSPVEVIVVNDGSTDRTEEVTLRAIAENRAKNFGMRLVTLAQNGGKANALNEGLEEASHEYIVTVDADSYLHKDALFNLVNHMIHSSGETVAVAGAVLVKNSRNNWITKLQEWDYFHGIAVVKRIQSLYQGTLVAQGAFSCLKRSAINECGPWRDTMGEDIVLTWGFHSRGYKVKYAENAIIFTDVPETYKKFYRQRRRWARGLIEAFKQHPLVLVKPRMNLPFIWYNLLFPYLDFVYMFFFIPGIFLAVFFHNYIIVGLMTLLLLPLALLINALMFYKQSRVFKLMGLKVRKNLIGFLFYMLIYQLIMTPACLAGYGAEFVNRKKAWGTK
ncbi:Glycosyl transferase family 2 [Candidatus Sulfobium mesophilum]|uniref:Glycosyl transferase family 2 n=1 Tax=Candidatus Sulfobium mesophilum TaxID=2016548 RepID=A0A2U3QEU2_9BACT|nr:Glycosyl transferase family 2 [Candidatus Sulfobium mesophilum]